MYVVSLCYMIILQCMVQKYKIPEHIVLIYDILMWILHVLSCVLFFMILQNVAQRHVCMWTSTCIALLYYTADIRVLISMFQSIVNYYPLCLAYYAMYGVCLVSSGLLKLL